LFVYRYESQGAAWISIFMELLVVSIQSLGNELPMKFFTFLGNENFFFLVLPMLYWSVDAGLGLRVASILITSNVLNSVGKSLFASPRPFWVSADVQPLSYEHSFGIPSGHAQNSAAQWGIMAAWLGKRWAWIAAVVIALLVGISRLYLGMHFPHDVVLGWLFGYVLLFLFIRFWDPVVAWLRTKTLITGACLCFPVVIAVEMLSNAPLNGCLRWRGRKCAAGPLPETYLDR
jgi:membrane-associated phospholipid phosphatase